MGIPLLGSIATLSTRSERSARLLGLVFSVSVFILSLFLWLFFDNLGTKHQFVCLIPWFVSANLPLYVGIDGLSLFFLLLTTFLTPVCLIFSYRSVKKQVGFFISLLLLLESLLILTFSVLDLVLFYVFFESILIPMFLLVGI